MRKSVKEYTPPVWLDELTVSDPDSSANEAGKMTRHINLAEAAARLNRPPADVARLCRIVRGLQATRANGHWELTESDVATLRAIVGEQLSLFDGAETHGKH